MMSGDRRLDRNHEVAELKWKHKVAVPFYAFKSHHHHGWISKKE